jgi:hypothetical protein
MVSGEEYVMKQGRGVVLLYLILLALLVLQMACVVVVRPRQPAAAQMKPVGRIVIRLVTPAVADEPDMGVPQVNAAPEIIIPATGGGPPVTATGLIGPSSKEVRLLILTILLVWVGVLKALETSLKMR